MSAGQHEPTAACVDVHCYYHILDEPQGPVLCGECFHSWPSMQALLADDTAMAEEHGFSLTLNPNPDQVFVCPFCAHDL